MKIYSVYDKEFKPYGKVLDGFDTAELVEAMRKIDLPESGVAYAPAIDSLEQCSIFSDLQNRAYGGMPIQLGLCWGKNAVLNCLEYHKDSEVNIGTGDFLLLLALVSEIEDEKLDTSKVKAFRVPAGITVEVYGTSLHYAPCHVDKEEGFRVAIVLPKGTNTDAPKITAVNEEDHWLWARNKWLLAHKDSDEAAEGAYVGLTEAIYLDQ